jgi:hypothetical protein
MVVGDLPPRKTQYPLYLIGWLDTSIGLDGCGKSRPHWDSIPDRSSPAVSRYTDRAITAHYINPVYRQNVELLNVTIHGTCKLRSAVKVADYMLTF